MVIGFVTAGLRFNGGTRTSLGGSETALLNMAKSMAKRGHEVVVFCACDQPGSYDGVNYFDVDTFKAFASTTVFDVLVVSRWVEFLSARTTAHLRVLWLHDTLVDNARVMQNLWQTDMIMALSDFHIENYTGEGCLPELKPHIWKTSNGVDMSTVKSNIRPKIKNKLIYTSRPERGLHFLLGDIFPRILSKVPDAKLYYANYDISQLRQLPEQVAAIIQTADVMAKRLGDKVISLGHLGKEELYQHISSSEILLFPTNFNEISCLTMMEAQACGTPAITTDAFALPETLSKTAGLLIHGMPPETSYFNNFAEQTVKLLQDDKRRKEMSIAGPKAIIDKGYTWDQVAASWENKFLEVLEKRSQNKSGVLRQLERNHDIRSAAVLAKDWNHPDAERYTKLVDETEGNGGQNVSTLPQDIKEALPRFHRVLDLLKDEIDLTKPQQVLDFASGLVSFGLFVKKSAPNLHVTIVDKDQDVLNKLKEIATKAKLEITFALEIPKDATYDIIFAGNYLDTVRNPEFTIDKLSESVKEEGYLCWSTRFGPTTPVLPKNHDRIWNFYFSDFKKMFDSPPKFEGSFVETLTQTCEDITGHWVCTLKVPYGKTIPLDLSGRKLYTRPYQTIAACMIVKNEEDNITKCLKNIRKVVDKIYVTDTGSTDQTIELIKPYVDEIRRVEFEDFSQARNFSKAGVKEDLVFWIDADEVLVGGEAIHKYLVSPIFNGWVLRQRHLMLDVTGTFDTPCRIFRNLSPYKFTGSIHEHCIAGDSLISLPGESKMVRDLVGKTDFWVWSYSHAEGKMVLKRAKRVWKVGRKKTLELIFDDGFLRCTEDHRIMLRTGEYIEAKDLKPGTSLMPFYRGMTKYGPRSRCANEWKVNLNNGTWVREHRYIWSQINGELSSKFDIHHKDDDHCNNVPSNLEAMDHAEHSRYTMNQWNTQDKIAKGHKRSEEYSKRAQKLYCSAYYSKEEMWKLIHEFKGCLVCVGVKCGSNSPVSSDSNTIYSYVYYRFDKLGIDLQDVRKRYPGKMAHKNGHVHITRESVEPELTLIRNNHKLLEIREFGEEDVYDIEVEETHNFVANGIVVHNCENTEISPYDSSIAPSIVLAGVDLAHYGYTNEGLRRNKCSNRNMKLLAKDVEENGKKGRMLTWVLVIRDYINMVQWAMGERGSMQLQHGSQEHILLNHAVATYIKYFADNKNRYSQLAFTMYQKSLELLGRSGLPFEFKKHPPFEVQLTLTGALGGLDPEKKIEPKSMWFIDDNQFMNFMTNQASNLVTQLGVADKSKYRKELKAKHQEIPFTSDPNRATELLALGTNVMPNRM